MRYLFVFMFVYTAFAAFETGDINPNNKASTSTKYIDNILVAKHTKTSNANSNIIKRGYVTTTCSDSQEAVLKAAMRECKTFADAAYHAVKDNQALRRKYFKTDSTKHINAIRDVYWEIEKGCDLERDNIPFRCEEAGGDCEGCGAYTYPSTAKVHLCPPFFTYSPHSGARTLIHELSHLNCIRGTDDHVYGDQGSQGLSKRQCLWNADNFAWFAYYAANPGGGGGYGHYGGGYGHYGGGYGHYGGGYGYYGGGYGHYGGGYGY